MLQRPVECGQYVSIRYSERLAKAGIAPSVGSVGDSYDNAMAETINGLYKAEVIHRRSSWKTKEAVELATLEWVAWFNHHRLLEPIPRAGHWLGDENPIDTAAALGLRRRHDPRAGLFAVVQARDIRAQHVVHGTLGLGNSAVKKQGLEIVKMGFAILDTSLARHDYAAGDEFTVADAALFYVERWAARFSITLLTSGRRFEIIHRERRDDSARQISLLATTQQDRYDQTSRQFLTASENEEARTMAGL